METRLAILEDAPALAAIHSNSFDDNSWSLTQITKSFSLDTTRVWLAYESDDILGFVMVQVVGDEAEILTFCVKTPFRRKGIGDHLLESVLTLLRQNRVHKVFLEVAIDNEPARTLYLKKGFSITNIRKGYYRRDSQKVNAQLFELIL